MRRSLTASVALAVLVTGCGGSGSAGGTTFDNPGAPLSVEAGKPFALTLPENPSTGYRWRFETRPDDEIVRFEDSSFELEEGGEDRDGAGGTRTFRFRAGRIGRTEFELASVFDSGGTERTGDSRRFVVIVR